jgi:hypothetical protein
LPTDRPRGHAQAKTPSEPAIPRKASTSQTLITGFLAPPKSGNVTIHRARKIGFLISYQNDGKGCALSAEGPDAVSEYAILRVDIRSGNARYSAE